MKKTLRMLLIFVLTVLMCSATYEFSGGSGLQTVEAHSGRTDSSGGHHDYKNASGLGSYHYHCGGHPAHLHPNGVCPYSGASAGGSSGHHSAPAPSISKKSASLYAGASLTLKVSNASQKVVWSSSKKSVATVNAKGEITAKKKGTTVITAQIGSRKLTCKVTVQPLVLNKEEVTLKEGKTVTLKLKGASKKITWSSSDPQVASVNSKGKVKALRAGTAVITARVMKKDYKCRITVKSALTTAKYL